MNNLKTLLFNRFKTISLICLITAFSIVLLMIRMKLTQSFYFIFLVWNLFLAIIPYTITSYLQTKAELKKIFFFFWLIAWLLFLPNAPYIITDLFHLRLSSTNIIWLDVLVVSSFASSGLLLFYLTLIDMKLLLEKYSNKKTSAIMTPIAIYLSSFGMYLGRFLRYNSWEIIQNPRTLFTDVINILIHPSEHYVAWLFTMSFGTFLTITYFIFNSFKIKEKPFLLKENINS